MTSGAEAMPLPDDVSAACESLREDLRSVATRIAYTQVAADTLSGVPGWSGAAADAYNDSVLRLGVHARADSLRIARYDAQEGILREYATAMDGLDEEARAAANAFVGASDAYLGSGSKRTRSAIGANLFNDIPVVDGQAEWEHALKIAPSIAQAMRDDDLSREDLQAFRDSYGDLLSNPFVANALMEELTADELNAFALRASTMGFEPGSAESELVSSVLTNVGTAMVLSTGGINADEAMAQQNEAFFAARDGVLGRQGQTMDRLVADQILEYMESGRRSYDYASLGLNGPYAWHAGYSVFSQLAGLAGMANPDLPLGPQFYSSEGGPSIADDLLAWEHENSEGARAFRGGCGCRGARGAPVRL